MNCRFDEETGCELQSHVRPGVTARRCIGVALYDGFALPKVARIIEIFHSANALTDYAAQGGAPYDVRLLSAPGGRIASSSSLFVGSERIEALNGAGYFYALFIAGGSGVKNALRDQRLITWLRYTYASTDLIFPIDEGRLLLEAAAGRALPYGFHDGIRAGDIVVGAANACASPDLINPMQIALAIVQQDLGAEIATRIADWVAPAVQTHLNAIERTNAGACVSEKIRASARWLEENSDHPIAIDDAAQAAAMSERNFLRRFKIEMGITPSEYLLHIRLHKSCDLLAETNLPVDEVARRCGIGCGARLSKLFRQHLATTPSQYRASKRPSERLALRNA
ncbi:AraC family transcriptional regulator [Paraburkholderia phytofirmans OLGA172]|uniref:AraC family transcriptional regulator n=1 Tax=Paraburkholderia phytofirmans OLGA172 TaxID=1417228 RepID=A0A160FRJ9_9BURK|nr:AraC family transcriptional regulator [Paraburkholderia phytofirmans OLGA172]